MKSCLLLPFSAHSLIPIALEPGICNFPLAIPDTGEFCLLMDSTKAPPDHKENRQAGREQFPITLSLKASAKEPLKAIIRAPPPPCP